MPYQSNIPQANDKISKSQGDILGNFQALGSNLFTGSNIAMPSVATPAALTGKMQIFVGPSSLTAPNLAMNVERESGTTFLNSIINFTDFSNVGNVAGSSFPESGWTRLPSGILLKWGFVAAAGSGSNVLNFPASNAQGNIPAFTAIYWANVTPVATAANIDTNTYITLNQIQIGSLLYNISQRFAFAAPPAPAASANVLYLAIGLG